MAFLFVPINSGILSQFGGATLGQVSGLLNLFRQIGGSMGIALVATLLNTRSHQNYIDIVSHISLLNRNTQSFFFGSVKGMMSRFPVDIGMTTYREAALKALYFRVNNQVFMMSFNQLIWVMMFIFSLSFIPLYFLKFKVKPTKAVDAH